MVSFLTSLQAYIGSIIGPYEKTLEKKNGRRTHFRTFRDGTPGVRAAIHRLIWEFLREVATSGHRKALSLANHIPSANAKIHQDSPSAIWPLYQMFIVGPNPPHISKYWCKQSTILASTNLKKNCNKQLAVEDTVGRRVFSLQLTLSTQALGLWMARPKLQEDLATNLRWPATNSWYSWYKKMGFLMPRLPPDFHQGDFSKIRTIGCKHSPRSKCWVDDLLFAGSLGHLLWASQKKYNQHARSTHFQRVAWGMER